MACYRQKSRFQREQYTDPRFSQYFRTLERASEEAKKKLIADPEYSAFVTYLECSFAFSKGRERRDAKTDGWRILRSARNLDFRYAFTLPSANLGTSLSVKQGEMTVLLTRAEVYEFLNASFDHGSSAERLFIEHVSTILAIYRTMVDLDPVMAEEHRADVLLFMYRLLQTRDASVILEVVGRATDIDTAFRRRRLDPIGLDPKIREMSLYILKNQPILGGDNSHLSKKLDEVSEISSAKERQLLDQFAWESRRRGVK